MKQVDHSLRGGPSSPPASFIWFHLIFSTYGSWLPGDDRGFRTRHHREHVEGDYKYPPAPGIYESRLDRSEELLKESPVILNVDWRETIGRALVGRLQLFGAFVLCASTSGQHAHLLAKLPTTDARKPCGLATKHAWFEARSRGWSGPLWAVRPAIKRVRSRRYQLNVYYYILDHVLEGAWVWSWSR